MIKIIFAIGHICIVSHKCNMLIQNYGYYSLETNAIEILFDKINLRNIYLVDNLPVFGNFNKTSQDFYSPYFK